MHSGGGSIDDQMLTRRELLQAVSAPAIIRASRRPGDKPNLLFLWTDQQRADTMAAYGNTRYRVPNMNRLAARSVVFDRPYVTQPVCTPSRSSVLTGFWPHQNGCVQNNIPLRPEVKTLPELLADSSYRTAYMGKWHLGDEVFPQRGFDEWRAIEDGIYQAFYSPGRDKNARSQYHQFLLSLGYKPEDKSHPNSFSRNFATRLPVEHSKPSFLAQEASNFILGNRREPWLLYVNTLEPHTPFSSALNDLHSDEECPLPANFPGIPSTPEPAWYKKRRGGSVGNSEFGGFDLKAAEGFRRAHRHYAGLCSLVDQMVGRILWALEVSGQAENTIIVYTSDHGEMMGAHSLLAKGVMYEEAICVPLLLHVPFRGQKPVHVPQPVSHIDIVPTLLELMGKKEAAGFPGRSLVPALTANRPPEDVFLEWTSDNEKGPSGRTVVTPGGYKFVWYDTDVSLLFDRSKDPLEMNNLIESPGHTATLRRLRAAIQA